MMEYTSVCKTVHCTVFLQNGFSRRAGCYARLHVWRSKWDKGKNPTERLGENHDLRQLALKHGAFWGSEAIAQFGSVSPVLGLECVC